jgi:MFS family permease
MKNPARWLTLAAVAWAFVLTAGLVYVVTALHDTNPAIANAGRSWFDEVGVKAIAIAVAPLVWIVVSAAVAWLASRKRSMALSVLAGVLTVIFGTVCGLTILAVFTPLPFVGMAFGLSAVLLLIAIFTERADITAERQRQSLSQMSPPDPAHLIAIPGTPTAP